MCGMTSKITFGPYGTLRGSRHGEKAKNRTMNHWDMAIALGLDPNKHLPAEGLPERLINGVLVWVTPKTNKGRRSSHRVLCGCPRCHKVMSAGRLAQHQKFCRLKGGDF